MTIHGIDTTFLVQVEVREVPGHEVAREWLDQALAKHPQPLALAPQVIYGVRPRGDQSAPICLTVEHRGGAFAAPICG